MAKFRDSVLQPLPQRMPANGAETATKAIGHNRSMGDILGKTRKLTPGRIDRILAHQREKGVRFGQAAVALGYATEQDVLRALAQQFQYPIASEAQRKLSPELVTLNEPFSRQAEVFRGIRSQLLVNVFGEHAQQRRALAIVSPGASDGKTFFAANLAVTLAQLAGRTLLVDANLRTPRLHRVFNLPAEAGLSSILSGRTETRVVQQSNVPGLFILPVGVVPPNPLELVERPAFGLLLHELISKFDHVVVDTSPAGYGADASVVAARCGAALVVARKNSSRVGELKELSETLSRTPATMASVVLNEY
jgi:protein-tyrosine kinase